MSFVVWIILELVAGFVGNKIVNKAGEGLFLDIILSIIAGSAWGCPALRDACGAFEILKSGCPSREGICPVKLRISTHCA